MKKWVENWAVQMSCSDQHSTCLKVNARCVPYSRQPIRHRVGEIDWQTIGRNWCAWNWPTEDYSFAIWLIDFIHQRWFILFGNLLYLFDSTVGDLLSLFSFLSSLPPSLTLFLSLSLFLRGLPPQFLSHPTRRTAGFSSTDFYGN